GFAPQICTHSHGSTAIAGMVYYAAENFPAQYRGNTFVGNVMTCRINRDSLIEHGSTRIAREEPDFLSSDDPWFRPVDLQLGPDGAIYVADFYNRIIGHYEVPLTHPGRDRERGRIWRIVYKGFERGPGRPAMNWSNDSAEDLAVLLHQGSFTRRMSIANHLVQRGGDSVISAVKEFMDPRRSDPFQRMHGL